MSTLTKVLIVLLSVFSLFLCGVVATYVANADNYKQQVTGQRTNMLAAQQRERAAQADLAQCQEAAEATKLALEQQLSDLEIERDQLQAALTDAQRDNAQLAQRVDSAGARADQAIGLQATQMQQTEAAQARVTQLEAELTRLNTRLDETNQALLEKLGIIETLQAERNRLAQANQELESRTNRYLQQYGRAAAPPQPVTPLPGPVQPAAPVRQIDLDGRIVRVENSLAEISIGEAAGVRENMEFYVTRGDQFIATLTVQYVYAEGAVGVLSRVQSVPQPGDVISTNL